MTKIKEICQQIGLVPTKRKGQNFLVNGKILEDIINAAELKLDDIILEIGPGLGVLTEKLAQKAKKVVAVELDKKLAAYLKEKFKNQPNVEIIQGDILKTDLRFKIEDLKYKLVANLPYNITGIVLRKFLSEAPKPNLMVLMVQKEVAERILAKNKKSAIISLMVAFYGKPEIIKFVSKNHFWPRPKVDSALLKITLTNADRTQTNADINEHNFFKLVRQGFSHPRKQLIGNLAKIEEKLTLKTIFQKLELNPKTRAEDLSLEQWLRVYYYIYEGR